jgi:hypothetical protein
MRHLKKAMAVNRLAHTWMNRHRLPDGIEETPPFVVFKVNMVVPCGHNSSEKRAYSGCRKMD